MAEVENPSCTLAREILENGQVRLVLILVALQDVVALILNLAVFYAVFQTRDTCDLLFHHMSCTLFSTISRSALDNLVMCFFIAAIERLIATVLSEKYEHYHYPVVVIILGIALPWIMPIISITEVITAPAKSNLLVYCSSLTSEGHDFKQLMFFDLPLCVGAIVIAAMSSCLSRFKKSRYQLNENIQVSRHIVRLAVFYSLVMMIHIGALSMVKDLVGFDSMVTFAIAKEWSSFIIPVFANAFPIVLILMHSTVSQKVFCGRPLFHKVNVAPLASTSEYFESYKRQWS
uniref:G_PROTEIN_RECEP_F1_2 domain-containing protein n=1 Tax=Panagrellus redivivus TaxID=6233 RepID=A0A7E4ZWX6_PANRE